MSSLCTIPTDLFGCVINFCTLKNQINLAVCCKSIYSLLGNNYAVKSVNIRDDDSFPTLCIDNVVQSLETSNLLSGIKHVQFLEISIADHIPIYQKIYELKLESVDEILYHGNDMKFLAQLPPIKEVASIVSSCNVTDIIPLIRNVPVFNGDGINFDIKYLSKS